MAEGKLRKTKQKEGSVRRRLAQVAGPVPNILGTFCQKLTDRDCSERQPV